MLKLFKMNYHPQLTDMMSKSMFIGAFAVNILTPSLLSYILHDYLNHAYIIWWLILNFFIFLSRVFLRQKLKFASRSAQDVNPILCAMIAVITFSALLHGYALWYFSMYVPDTQLFFVASVTIALVAGSISTLGSVYHAFATFVILNLIPIIFVFSSKGEAVFYIFSFSVFIYMFVMHNGF